MIERIGQVLAEATTFTVPAGHKVGDILVGWAFRDGSTTNPTIPSPWTTLTNTLDGTTCSVSVGWKPCLSAAESSGTWTNATATGCVCLRGADSAAPVITSGTSAGTTNTVTYNALTDAALLGAMGYWIGAFIGHRSTDVTVESAPTGMSNLAKLEGATNDCAIQVAASDDTWPSTNVAISGTASGWVTYVFAVRPARLTFNNYLHVKGGTSNAGILSFAERIR